MSYVHKWLWYKSQLYWLHQYHLAMFIDTLPENTQRLEALIDWDVTKNISICDTWHAQLSTMLPRLQQALNNLLERVEGWKVHGGATMGNGMMTFWYTCGILHWLEIKVSSFNPSALLNTVGFRNYTYTLPFAHVQVSYNMGLFHRRYFSSPIIYWSLPLSVPCHFSGSGTWVLEHVVVESW